MKNCKYITNLFFILLYTCISLEAKNYKDEITDFTLLQVRDGDTFTININNIPDVFGNEIAVRIRGIDTPEKTDKRPEIKALSLQAKNELETLLKNGKNIKLYNLGRDKYFRLLASVEVDGIDVANYLIKKGLAKKYSGGKKEW